MASSSGGRDFQIDLRMQADFDAARKAIRDTGKDLDNLADKASKAGSVDAGGGDAGAPANTQAQQAYLAASRATQQAIAEEIGLIGKLEERVARSASSWENLADAEATLDKAMAKGLITAEEYDEALAKLDKSQAALEKSGTQQQKALDATLNRYDKAGAQVRVLAQDEAKLKKALDDGRISREAYNKAMANLGAQRAASENLKTQSGLMRRLSLQSAGTQRDLTQLAIYSARGDWQLAGNQILQLGSRAGVASTLMSGLGVALIGTGGALAGFALAAVKGYTQMRALESALVSTGNSAGITVGELAEIRNTVGDVAGQYGKAQEALVALTSSGKFAGDTLASATSAAVNLATLTGQSISQTSGEIARLAEAPVEGLLKLDERYRFLTLEVYDQVKALEEQGKKQEAVAVGIATLDRVMAIRAENMRKSAGYVETAWRGVAAAISGAIQRLMDFGRSDEIYKFQRASERLVAAGQARRAQMEAGVQGAALDSANRLIILRHKEFEAAKNLLQQEKTTAAVRGQTREADANSIKARQEAEKAGEEFDRLRVSNLSKAAKLEREIAEIRRLGEKAGKTRPEIEEQVALARARYKESLPKGPKPKKTEAEQANEAARRELENMARELAMLGEMEGANGRLTRAIEIRYAIERGALQGASEANKQALIDAAQLLDSETMRKQAAQDYVQVQLEILALQGRPVPPELDQERQKLEELAKWYETYGMAAEAAGTRKLMSLRDTGAELEALQRNYQQIMGEIDLAQQRIQVQVQTGFITEAEGQRQIAQLYNDKAALLDQLVPKMEAAAIALGSPEALANVQRIKFELEQMRNTTDLLVQTIGNTFEGAFSNALMKLSEGTASLGDAVRGFFLDMAQGLAQFAAQQLAAAAKVAVIRRLRKLTGTEDSVAAGAAKLDLAAAKTIAAGGAIALGATQLIAAAAALAAAGGASGGGGSGGVASFVSSLIGAFGGSGGYSGGGYTGRGGKYTPAGVVHKGEGVFSQEDIAALGGPAGFYALRAALGASRARFNGVGAPRVSRGTPPMSFAEGGFVSGSSGLPAVHLRNINLFDLDDLVTKLAAHPAMEAMTVNHVELNSGKVRQAMGG